MRQLKALEGFFDSFVQVAIHSEYVKLGLALVQVRVGETHLFSRCHAVKTMHSNVIDFSTILELEYMVKGLRCLTRPDLYRALGLEYPQKLPMDDIGPLQKDVNLLNVGLG